MNDLPRISSGEDWLDLTAGDEALLKARLESVSSNTGLLMTFSDWSQIVARIVGDDVFREQGLDRLRDEGIGRQVQIVVTRDEDGIFVDAGALVAAEIA